jgi:tryptophan 2,3-dioxygenase
VNITNNNKIAIIGAGLCGSTLAILLQKKGYDVTVYEKQAREQIFGEEGKRSINLFLSKRAEISLTEAGVWEQIKAECVRVRGRYYHIKNGRPAHEKEDAVLPYSNNPEETNYSIKRSTLNMLLIEEAESRQIGINFDTGIDKDVLARLKSEYSAVICASGLGFDKNTALWRSTGEGENCRQNEYEFEYFETAIPENLLEERFPYRSAGDIARGTDYLHIWSFAENFMIIALPNQDHSHNCIVFFKERKLPAGENYSELDFNNWGDFIREQTAEDPAFAGAFTGICERQPAKISKLMDLRCENWVDDNLLMIGDCSHAVLPFHGQGANAAMEDAKVLYERLPDVNEVGGNIDWKKEFYGFFSKRKKDADALWELAREYHYSLIGSGGGPDDARLLLRLAELFPYKFESEYHMVTFSDRSYAEALKRYETERKILTGLVRSGELREKLLAGDLLAPDEVSEIWNIVGEQLAKERSEIKKLRLFEKIDENYQFDNEDGIDLLLEGLADPNSKGVVYWDYLEVDTLLSLQKPRTTYPDEVVFIIYHQIHELYFKLMIQELEKITSLDLDKPILDAEDIDIWEKGLTRSTRYMYKLIGSFDIIKNGLDSKEFGEFRKSLLPASGFQTHQFRLIEIMLTSFRNLVNADVRQIIPGEAAFEEQLEKYFDDVYWRKGAISRKSGEKAKVLVNFNLKYDELFRGEIRKFERRNLHSRYQKAPSSFPPELIEAMKDLEKSILMWKVMHFNTISFHIPTVSRGTGGTNWKEYLQVRNQKIFYFPEFWRDNDSPEKFDAEIARMKEALPDKITGEMNEILNRDPFQ